MRNQKLQSVDWGEVVLNDFLDILALLVVLLSAAACIATYTMLLVTFPLPALVFTAGIGIIITVTWAVDRLEH